MSETDHTTTDAPQGLADAVLSALRDAWRDDYSPQSIADEIAEQVRAHLSDRLASPEVVEAAAAEFMRPEHGCDGTEKGCRDMCPVPLYEVASHAELARAALAAAVEAL